MTRTFKHWLTTIFFSPVALAIPFALITIYLIPMHFGNVELQLDSSYPSDKIGKNSVVRFIDLDNDGFDEEIIHFKSEINQCAIKIRTRNQASYGQWNFDGQLPMDRHPLAAFDINHDGIREVFTLYQRNDSVFLGGINIMIDSAIAYNNLFIDRIQKVNDTIHYGVLLFHHDLDQDGVDEAIVCINAGFSEKPRRIYAYNFVNHRLIKSIQTGFTINGLRYCDLDGDGYDELIATTSSNENIEPGLGIPYDDYHRWLAVYDHDLKLNFNPIDLGKGGGSVHTLYFGKASDPRILILDHPNRSLVRCNFYQYNPEDRQLDKLHLDVDSLHANSFYEYTVNNDTIFLLADDDDGSIYHYYPSADSLIYIHRLKYPAQNIKIRHLDQDSLPQLITINRHLSTNKLIVYTGDFEDHSELTLPNTDGPILVSVRQISKNNKRLVLQINEDLYEYIYKHDKYHALKSWALYLGIYLLYVLMIWVIMRVQKTIMQKRYAREQTIAELKLKSIRNQMDPHFTFNAVNAIASAIYKEDKQTAYAYFSKFSKLIRSTMLYSDRMSRFLDDEIDFTVKYLEIEKFRFREKFDYFINVDKNVNLRQEVPRMIVQAFAESAVANGLMHRSEGGRLDINLREEKNALVISFTDNGVGIEKSKQYNKEKAFKSIRIIDEFIAVFNDLNKSQITYRMFDTMEEGKVTGTKVIIHVPLDMNYAFKS